MAPAEPFPARPTVATLVLAILAGLGAAWAVAALFRAGALASASNPASLAGVSARAAGYLAAAAVMLAQLPALVAGGAAALGLAGRRWRWIDTAAVVIGVVAVVILRGLAYAYLVAIGSADYVQYGLENFAVTNALGAAGAIAVAVTVAAFAEELFYRGIIYGALETRTTPLRAAAASGLLFALGRVDLVMFPFFALYGMLLAVLYRWTRTLWVPIAVRAIFDGMMTATLVWLDLTVR